jgi:hypothetical protein
VARCHSLAHCCYLHMVFVGMADTVVVAVERMVVVPPAYLSPVVDMLCMPALMHPVRPLPPAPEKVAALVLYSRPHRSPLPLH